MDVVAACKAFQIASEAECIRNSTTTDVLIPVEQP